MALVTVVIPTFNRLPLLTEALESVFAQTYEAYEVLIVDDGSTDGTQKALVQYGDRLRYVWKPNGGEASARNFGVARSTTEYVAFLDSDDLWEPGFLETVMAQFSKHPELALVATGCIVTPTGEQRPGITQSLLQGQLFTRLYERNLITASAVAIRRESLIQAGDFDETLEQATDYDMWLRLAKRHPIAVLNVPLCRWRRHAGNISAAELRHRQSVLDLIDRHDDPSRIPRSLYRLRRSRLIGSLGRAYLRCHDIAKAQACFREAVRLTPWRLRAWRDSLIARLAKMKAGRRIPSSDHDNQDLPQVSARIKDRRGIGWMTRRLKHRLTPGAVILCYHRVGDLLADPYSLSIRFERFEEQMEHLYRHAAPVHLSELVACVREGTVRSGMVAVTFDDGFASVLDHAYPTLLRLGIPATVFATSDYLGSARESWSDELEQILLQPSPLPEYLSITLDERPFHWHLEQSASYSPDDAIRYRTWTLTSHHDPTSRHLLFRTLFFRLLSLTEASRLAVLNQLVSWSEQTPQCRPTHRFLSPEELTKLAADPLMEIGSHSMSHPVLPKQPSQRQREEIAGSRDVLRALTGGRIQTFCYPYGARSPVTIQLVKQAGFDSACTTFTDVVFASADPFQLPRVHVGDWNAYTFARRLGLDTGG